MYLKAGTSTSFSGEENTRIFVANLFAFIGYSITFILGLSALASANYTLGYILIITSVIFYSPRLLLKFKKIKSIYLLNSRIFLTVLIFLMTYLVISGGRDNTGPLWIYTVPPVAFYVAGLRKGNYFNIAFLFIVSVIFYWPIPFFDVAEYSDTFKSRIILSFLTVMALFGFYEYSRQQVYEHSLKLNQKFKRQAQCDSLTGLSNRRHIRELITDECKRAKNFGLDMSILICDVDYFKNINDKYGHETGDNILIQITRVFLDIVREKDLVSRWGGEEFLFVLPETDEQSAKLLAERIRSTVEQQKFTYKNVNISITVSIGVTQVNLQNEADVSINIADHFLYQAKESGRNQIRPS